MPVLIGSFEPHSEEWYDARVDGLGSSDIAALVGDSKYATPYSVWVEKVAPETVDRESNRWQEWGTRLEDVIADKFADEHPEFDVQPTGTWHADGRSWQRANPDRLLTTAVMGMGLRPADKIEALLEIKTGARAEQWADGVPAGYEAQITWQADVMDVDVVYVAVLLSGSDYREYRIEVDEFSKSRLRNIGDRFWHEHVLTLTPPDLDGFDPTLDAVWRTTPPPDPESTVEVGDDLTLRWLEARTTLDEAEAAFKRVKAEMLITLGDAKYGTHNGARIALRKHYPKAGIDTKALKADHPDIAAKYATSTTINSIEAVRPKGGDDD